MAADDDDWLSDGHNVPSWRPWHVAVAIIAVMALVVSTVVR